MALPVMGINMFIKVRIRQRGDMTQRNARAFVLLLVFLIVPPAGYGEPGQRVSGVTGQGACIIDRITAEEARQLALRRARADAIEKAAGVKVDAATVVKNSALAVDFIKSYARGYIVNETVQWHPLAQYQETTDHAPVPEYRVTVTADVIVPEAGATLGLSAALNRAVFQRADSLTVSVAARVPVNAAIFNIMADDRVVMLYPAAGDQKTTVGRSATVFPLSGSGLVWEVDTLPGHKRNAEAVFVVAAPAGTVDFESLFEPMAPMAFTRFFQTYADVAGKCQDTLLAYVVEAPDR